MKKNIILGITGSIAAYKAADIANTLTKEGHSVHVIMTKAAMEFITPLTLQTLTKNKVHTDQFAPYIPSEVEHISLAQKADLFLVCRGSVCNGHIVYGNVAALSFVVVYAQCKGVGGDFVYRNRSALIVVGVDGYGLEC